MQAWRALPMWPNHMLIRMVLPWLAGWLALADFATAAECDTLRSRANELTDAFDPQEVTFFSTTNQVYKLHSSTLCTVTFGLEPCAMCTRCVRTRAQSSAARCPPRMQ